MSGPIQVPFGGSMTPCFRLRTGRNNTYWYPISRIGEGSTTWLALPLLSRRCDALACGQALQARKIWAGTAEQVVPHAGDLHSPGVACFGACRRRAFHVSDAQMRPCRAYSLARRIYGMRNGICASDANMGVENAGRPVRHSAGLVTFGVCAPRAVPARHAWHFVHRFGA